MFVAGQNGLVGSAVVRNAPLGNELITAARNEVDLSDKVQVKRFLERTQPDAIILAAARVGGILANANHQREFLLSNLEIQNSVIDTAASLGISKLIFLGSSCIYPKFAPQPISEDSLLTGLLEPTNEAYALAKIAGIRLCKAISDEFGYNYFSLMPTNLYGPNDNYDLKSSHVPAALMRKFHEAKIAGKAFVEIWGTGSPRREFMHSDDMAKAIWHMLNVRAPGELINVGTGFDTTIKEFAYMMANIIGFQGEIKFDHTKPDGTPRKLLDVHKINSLGWQSQINLETGLKETYKWFIHALKKGEIRGF